jgi:hypothetical protein
MTDAGKLSNQSIEGSPKTPVLATSRQASLRGHMDCQRDSTQRSFGVHLL